MYIKNISGLWKRMKKCWILYLIMLIPFCSVILFNYAPMYGVQIAFRNYSPARGISGSPWIGMTHFIKFITSFNFGLVVKNTLRLSLLSLLCGPPLAVAFALMLNTVRKLRLKKFIQTVTYAPNFISIVVLVGMLNMFFSPAAGLYGSIYKLLNNGRLPPTIMGVANTFVPTYILSGVWQGLGFSSIIYLAALSAVDIELHEAAVIDGATRLRRVFCIDIPAIIPTISITTILAFGGIMNVGFEKVYLMQTSLNASYSEVIATYIYKHGLQGGISGFSYGAAIGLLNSVINCVMLLLVNFAAKKLSQDGGSLF